MHTNNQQPKSMYVIYMYVQYLISTSR